MEACRTVAVTLVKNKVFGDAELLDLQPDSTDKGEQFASDLIFLNLIVKDRESDKKNTFPLVIKKPFSDPRMRIARNCDAMFHNELTMYEEVLPCLGIDENFYPKMYYGVATSGSDPENDILVLENLKHKNFYLSKTKIFLDIDHINIAIKKIAEFHSHSYALRHNNAQAFFMMSKKFKEVTLPDFSRKEFGAVNVAAMKRGMQQLIKNNINGELLKTCLTFLKDPYHIRSLISSAEEPFGVICHGDYCNNNILYKFNDSEVPIDCVFFDFQLAQYGSPAIDIFFFLYMHTTSELREEYWDEILKLYWDTLRKNVPNHIAIPNFEDFLKHFAERAIYGYIISSFFLPAMMMKSPVKWQELYVLSQEERISILSSLGGDESEGLISNIVLHLLNKGYIKSFIEFAKKKNVST